MKYFYANWYWRANVVITNDIKVTELKSSDFDFHIQYNFINI